MKTMMSETEAYQYIITLVYERCGIRLHHGKEALIKARLGKRMRHHGLDGLAEYGDFLQRRDDEEEFSQVIDAVTTNFTNFMREAAHFEFLVKQALPSVLRRKERSFRVWSAACSSGEEAYTLAFQLFDCYPPAEGWGWRITATDISSKVLAQAQRGIYLAQRLGSLPAQWLPRYFQRGVGRWAEYYRVKTSIAERVTFRHLNLIEPYSHTEPFEVIFCRNVMIYFDRPTQERLVQQLCQFLVPGGYVLIGHSESLNGLQVPLRCLRPSIYRKDSL